MPAPRRRGLQKRVLARQALPAMSQRRRPNKNLAIEHVRYRDDTENPQEVKLQAPLKHMHDVAVPMLSNCACGAGVERLPWPPSFASSAQKDFLKKANNRFVWVKQLQGTGIESRKLGAQYAKLLQDIPSCCLDKFGEHVQKSQDGSARADLGLVQNIRASSSSRIASARAGC